MIRRVVFALLFLGAGLGSAPTAAGALLRSHVLVDGPMVTLGDLFDNVGDRAKVQVLNSPPPGQSITVDTDWLTHVAVLNGVAWKPRDLFDEAVIERTGLVIGRDQIVAALQQALRQRGAPADFTIELEGRTQQMVVATDTSSTLSVPEMFYDRPGNRFSATVAAGQSKLMLTGVLYPSVEVPVPAHPLARGDVVSAQDIVLKKMREDEVRPSMVRDAVAMIGLAAKVPLRADQPVLAGDLQKPLAVTRGALVALVLDYRGMSLTAQGRAIDQGALGDTIRVTNTHSNLTVEGVVDGINRVRVSLTGPVALAN